MNSITMCNYYGMCDSENRPVGHAIKVTNEYRELLDPYYKVSIAASPCIIKAVTAEGFLNQTMLTYDIVSDHILSLKSRVLDKCKLMHNIRVCFRLQGPKILLFYQVDFFFFFYITFFHRRKKGMAGKKILCLIYHQNFTGGRFESILDRIYQKALKKIDGVIYTQKGNPVNHPNSCWMPDYLYDRNQYNGYFRMPKKEKIVCLGTMNRYKQLEQLLEVFSEISYELEIIGRFDDQERFYKLLEQKRDHISITDTILSETDYYEILAGAKYSMIPYDMDQYQNRTSGVLLESLYVGSIPIAPVQLLEQNHLPGYGYDDMKELKSQGWKQISSEDYHGAFEKVYAEYGHENVMRGINDLISRIVSQAELL